MTEQVVNHDAFIMEVEMDAIRPVVAEQVAESGGLLSWLDSRVAAGQQLSASEALVWLDLIRGSGTTLASGDLEKLAAATSVAPWKGGANTTVTILYSNGTAGGTASSLGAANPDTVRIIDHSHVGQLLANDDFRAAAEQAFKGTGDGSERAVTAAVDKLLYTPATLSEDGTRSGAGLWDQASARFAVTVSGDVITLTSSAEGSRTFAVTELEALLDSPDVDTINGMSRSLHCGARHGARGGRDLDGGPHGRSPGDELLVKHHHARSQAIRREL